MPEHKAKTRSLIALLIMLVGSVGIDQITKVTAEENLMVWEDSKNLKIYQGREQPVWSIGVPPKSRDERETMYLAFNFNYVRNQGAAWGFLSDLKDSIRIPFFYIVTLLATLIIGLYLKNTPYHHRTARYALVLVLSGACGNFADRLRLGYVIDFLDFRWNIPLPFPITFNIDFFPKALSWFNFSVDLVSWRYNFPNFNWADSMITIGVILLFFDMLYLEARRKKKELQDDVTPSLKQFVAHDP